MFKRKNKEKIFCIGFNKTGTTSLQESLTDLGIKMGNQWEAEHLFDSWVARDFVAIEKYCKKYEGFQDAPFSFPFTYIGLDILFPKSKFILTVRDSSEQWYNSVINFHGKMWGNGNIPPTSEDLEKADYLYKGFPLYSIVKLFGTTKEVPYNKEIMISHYERHNKYVQEYFKYRPTDLLVINVSDPKAYLKLCDFLNKKPLYDNFPWLNKT